MRIQGPARVADFMGELIVYRRLEPADSRVPGLSALAGDLGLAGQPLPRKAEPAYARVVERIMRAARAVAGGRDELRSLVYVGDSPGLDLAAFGNLVRESGWNGWAFIGADRAGEPAALQTEGRVSRGNRWALLAEFLRAVRAGGVGLDASLAVVVDLDKTILGPRGRNDATIDEARTVAGAEVARRALGSRFSKASFERIYGELQQAKYHFFTEDNQDFLVYVSLLLAAGVYGLDDLLRDLAERRVASFGAFLNLTDGLVGDDQPDGLRAIRAEVSANYRAGDPTPFKTFRREEFRTTLARMDPAPDDDLGRVLRERITINHEVAQFVSYLRERGALALGLSDKPDEAVFPSSELAAEGYPPLHRASTLAVGQTLDLG